MTEELSIVLRAKDEASKVIDDLSKKTKASFADISKQVGASMTVVGGAITGFLGVSVKNAMDAQVEMAKVDTILKTMGGNFGEAKKRIEDASQAMIKFGFDDEETAVNIAKLYQKTGDLNEAMDMNQMAMDLARYKNISLADAGQALGMVLVGNTKVLKSLGIEVDQHASKEMQLAQAQKILAGQAEDASKTFAIQMKAMGIEMTNVRETIGNAIIPILTDLLKQVRDVTAGIADWAKAHPELFEQIVKFTAVAGGIMVVLGPILIALPALVAGITALFGPLGIILVAIAGVVAVLWQLYQKGMLTKQAFKELMDHIDQSTGIITVLREAWNQVYQAFTVNLLPTLKKLWDALTPLKPYFEALAKILSVVFMGSLILIVKFIAETVTVTFNTLATGIEWLTKGINFAKDAFDAFTTALANVINWADKVISKVEAMISSLSRAKNAVGGAIGGAIDNAYAGIKGVLGLADGGIVTQPTLAMIGEAGEPEAVIPLSKLQGTGGGITVNINGGYYLSKDVARELGNEIISMLKMQRRI